MINANGFNIHPKYKNIIKHNLEYKINCIPIIKYFILL